MAAADYRLLTEATGVRIAEALEDVTAMVGPKGDPGDVSEAELTAKLADKASAIVDTASGAIASFPDGAAVPAKDITIGIEPVQSGSGDPSPTNVRPISGWTGSNVTRTGKNLLRVTATSITTKGVTFTVNEDGSIILNGTSTGGIDFYLNRAVDLPSNTYAISIREPSQGSIDVLFAITTNGVDKSTSTGDTFTGSCSAARLFISNNKTFNNAVIKPMICLASVPDPYVFAPYTGTTIPISWQSEAGTVYGGTLDVTTGVLTVDRVKVVLDGTQTFAQTGDGKVFYSDAYRNGKVIEEHYAQAKAAMSCFKNELYAPNVRQAVVDNAFCFGSSYLSAISRLVIRASQFNDVSALTTWFTNNPQDFVYELATPQTYQLTPTQVALLLGQNNVWADCGDVQSLEYVADTKLYIQKINTPTDDDMTADAQIASGKYFIVGGNLYRSTTTIPAGDTITPGTNCILTNLADALNALNT